MDATSFNNIPKEKFRFANKSDWSHDKKLDTKPVGYFHDAFRRFCKNKGAIVAAIIILIILLLTIIAPFLTPYTVTYSDSNFNFMLPRNSLFLNTSFWDGCSAQTSNAATFREYYYMGEETGHYAIKNQEYTIDENGKYSYRLDSYHKLGCIYMNVSNSTYMDIQKYQNETGRQVLYPVIAPRKRPEFPQLKSVIANYYYEVEQKGSKKDREIVPVFDENGNLKLLYKTHGVGSENKPDEYNSIRIKGDGDDGKEYEYALRTDTDWQVRVNYYEYYIYEHSYRLKDGITEPSFLFGTNNIGKDVFICLFSGARFSFLFAIAVEVVNVIVGAIYGSIAGYYGGKLDLIMERIRDILGSIPFMIVITLLQLHMHERGINNNALILFVAFFATGWIGMAGLTRMQFYRYKNQEYVLAARTLGARDRRIMFKHIFPNALGTMVTSVALVIPSMIFSETSLSYLGIINLETGNITSVGTLLASGQPFLTTYPHIILFPSLFLALLMLSFNLFGNGLRDAFNPSLRGTEG